VRPQAALADSQPQVAADPTPPPTPAPEPAAAADEPLRRLIGAITHEVRNPLVAIRTFCALLPERFDDPDFRGRFAGIVGADVRRIEGAVDRLARFASLGTPERKPVDVSDLLDDLLEGRRDEIRDRRLVVLRELDRAHGTAIGDAAQLRFAFEALLTKALELVPDRGDVYVASRHHQDALHGGPSLRVLLRFPSPDEILPTLEVKGVSLSETALELVLADAIVRAQGGTMTASTADSRETVLLIDLPA
jgi:signal transduction histidine kinase